MISTPGRPKCPLCCEVMCRSLLYPAFGRPICEECDANLLENDAIFAAACREFRLSPMLLIQIVEEQEPRRLTSPIGDEHIVGEA